MSALSPNAIAEALSQAHTSDLLHEMHSAEHAESVSREAALKPMLDKVIAQYQRGHLLAEEFVHEIAEVVFPPE